MKKILESPEILFSHFRMNPGYAYPSVTLTLCILMNFPILIDTISMGLPIVHLKGSQVEA